MAGRDLSRLRREPGYPLFWATATVTRLADEMYSVGIVLLVLERTGSAGLAEATSFNFAVIGGPALAGTISAISSPAASLLVEAVLTLGAIALIARIPAMDASIAQHARRSLVQIARAGLRHVAGTPPLRAVTA